MGIRRFFFVVFCFLPNHLAAAKIDNACFANAWESCYITIEGTIDHDTPAQFANSMHQMDGGTVLLNSGGGDSMAAIALGKMIRGAGLSTQVGAFNPADFPTDGVCLNACIFAFAGGNVRGVSQGGRVAFSWAQQLHLQHIQEPQSTVMATSFLIEMGVDAALLLHNAESGQLTPDDFETYNLTYTPQEGFLIL